MTDPEKQEHKTKVCDNKSVGMIIRKGVDVLLIERRKPPFGFAPPAGHVESGYSFEETARKEVEEEVGLIVKELEFLTEGRKDNNSCSRGGTWHYWKIYQVKAEGKLKPSEDETKQADWFSPDQIKLLANRTNDYLSGNITEEEWQTSPGIEPVWLEWFKELGIAQL